MSISLAIVQRSLPTNLTSVTKAGAEIESPAALTRRSSHRSNCACFSRGKNSILPTAKSSRKRGLAALTPPPITTSSVNGGTALAISTNFFISSACPDWRGAFFRPFFFGSKRSSSPSTTTRRLSARKGTVSQALRNCSGGTVRPSRRMVLGSSEVGSPILFFISSKAWRSEKSSSPISTRSTISSSEMFSLLYHTDDPRLRLTKQRY